MNTTKFLKTLIALISMVIFILLSSCSSSGFSGDHKLKQGQSSNENDGKQGGDDDDDDDDENYDDDDNDNVPEISQQEVNGLKFSNIKVKTRRSESDRMDGFRGTNIVLSLYKIGGKKVPSSVVKKTKMTINLDPSSSEGHSINYGSLGLCPDNKKKIVLKMQVNHGILGSDVAYDGDYVIGAKVDKEREMHVGIADDGDHGGSGPAFHNIDSWVVQFVCPNKNKLNIAKFPCWDSNLESNPALLRCWAITGPDSSCPDGNVYSGWFTSMKYPAACK